MRPDVDDGRAVLCADVGSTAPAARRRCGSCPGTRLRQGAAARRAPRRVGRRRSSAPPPPGAGRGSRPRPARRGGPAEGHDLGPEVGHRPCDGGERPVGRGRRRRQHPDGTLEHRGVGAVETVELEPAIGWPPQKRSSVTAAVTGPLTLATSVTSPLVAASACLTRSGTADAGVATKVIAARVESSSGDGAHAHGGLAVPGRRRPRRPSIPARSGRVPPILR